MAESCSFVFENVFSTKKSLAWFQNRIGVLYDKHLQVGESFRYVRENYGEETFFNLYETQGVLDHHPTLLVRQ